MIRGDFIGGCAGLEDEFKDKDQKWKIYYPSNTFDEWNILLRNNK